MDALGGQLVRYSGSFPCQAASVALARQLVRGKVWDLPPEALEATELMVSELATNCVLHARTDFELTIGRTQGELRVEVSDGVSTPPVRQLVPQAQSGRGLQIVELLADAWGVTTGAHGKTVWFTLSVATDGSRAQR
jgi:two-component sensor histidine kinase